MNTKPIQSIPLAAIQTAASGNRPADPGLVESVKQHGILQPVALVADGDGFRPIFGTRRLDAAKRAGLDAIPSTVYHDLTPTDERVLCLVENCQRTDVTPLEEGRIFCELVDLGLSQTEIARRVSKTRAYIAPRVRLASLPTPVLQVLERIPYNLSALGVLFRLPADRLVAVLDENPGAASDCELARDAVQAACRSLSSAPFETAGCAGCGKREEDLCMDSCCFDRHVAAHVAASIQTIRKEYPTAPTVVSREGVRRASAEDVNIFNAHGAGSLRGKRLAEEGEGGEPAVLLDDCTPRLVHVVPDEPSADGRATRYSPDGQESLDLRKRLQDAVEGEPRPVTDRQLPQLVKALAGALEGRDGLSASEAYHVLLRAFAPALSRRLKTPPPDSDRAADFRRVNAILP